MYLHPQAGKNHRHPQHSGPRVNERIRAPEVLVIGPDGQKMGIFKTEVALQKAKSLGLDLIEVAPTANPPVCKILDFGKFRYQQDKHRKEFRKHSQASKLKEIKLRPHIAEHDYMTKLRLAEAFLDKGMKVKFSLWFKGREMEFASSEHELTKRIMNDLAHIGHCDAPPRMSGRSVVLLLSPLPAQKRVRKYSKNDELIPEEDDEELTDTSEQRLPDARCHVDENRTTPPQYNNSPPT